MPWSNYPQGVSLTTQTGVTNGLLNATAITLTSNTATAAGTITVGTVSALGAVITSGQLVSSSTLGIVGGLAGLVFSFGVASTLQVTSMPVPFAGSLDNCIVTTGSVSAVVAAYTVRIGSAGSVAVATVSNTTASQGVSESLTTTATTFALTNALVCTRSVQGTAGDTAICLVVRQTA